MCLGVDFKCERIQNIRNMLVVVYESGISTRSASHDRKTEKKIEFAGWLQNICSTLVQGSVVRRSKPIAYLYQCDFKNRLIIN